MLKMLNIFKPKSVKNIIRIIILVPLSIFLLYCINHFIVMDYKPTYPDCGTVISKSTDEVIVKHGTITELYLNVQFEKSGFKSIEVTETTYFKSKKGEYICFNLNEDRGFWYNITNVIGLITIIIICGILLIWFLIYILPESW